MEKGKARKEIRSIYQSTGLKMEEAQNDQKDPYTLYYFTRREIFVQSTRNKEVQEGQIF